MACCVRTEPALLRALRRRVADTGSEPGLEGLAWGFAPTVLAGERFCELAPEVLPVYRPRFGGLPPEAQRAILESMLDLHAHRGRSTESAEILLWSAHAATAPLPASLAGRHRDAEAWFDRLAKAGGEGPGDVSGFARDLLGRQGSDATWIAAQSARLAPLWALTGEETIPAGILDGRARGRAGAFP
jgi:hypothetical protein